MLLSLADYARGYAYISPRGVGKATVNVAALNLSAYGSVNIDGLSLAVNAVMDVLALAPEVGGAEKEIFEAGGGILPVIEGDGQIAQAEVPGKVETELKSGHLLPSVLEKAHSVITAFGCVIAGVNKDDGSKKAWVARVTYLVQMGTGCAREALSGLTKPEEPEDALSASIDPASFSKEAVGGILKLGLATTQAFSIYGDTFKPDPTYKITLRPEGALNFTHDPYFITPDGNIRCADLSVYESRAFPEIKLSPDLSKHLTTCYATKFSFTPPSCGGFQHDYSAELGN